MKPLFYNFKLIHPEQLLPTPYVKDRNRNTNPNIDEAVSIEHSITHILHIIHLQRQDLEYKDYE